MKTIIAALLFILALEGGTALVRAQSTAAGPSIFWSTGTLASCPVTFPITAGNGAMCVGTDHLGYAPAGATKWIQLDVPAAAGVTSVNGKTGAVVLGATTTLQ